MVADLSKGFLVFEGGDGSGKTTQYRRVLENLRERRFPVEEVREPGGTEAGEEIRRVLLDHSHGNMSLTAEMLLYMASRAQLIEQLIKPALKRGSLVLADRFFQSTDAYQLAGGELDRIVCKDDFRNLCRIVCGDCRPGGVWVFDVPVEIAIQRIGANPDRIESRNIAYKQRVRERYLRMAKENPDTYHVIDGTPDPEIVFAGLMPQINAYLEENGIRPS